MLVTLAAVVLLFGLLHILPALPRLKSRASRALGMAYGPMYGIASLALFVLAVWSFRQLQPEPLYAVVEWGRHANFAFSLAGFLCLGVFLCRGSWRNKLRHPMALAVAFWAAGHLLANGDVGTTVLFGGFLLIAVVHAALRQKQGMAPVVVREGHNLLSLFAGVALYGLAVQMHQFVAGVSVVQLR